MSDMAVEAAKQRYVEGKTTDSEFEQEIEGALTGEWSPPLGDIPGILEGQVMYV